MNDFLSWLENENSDQDLINEYGNFMEPLQSPGDFVFFGIHLLNREYNELNRFPFVSLGNTQDSERIDISQYVTKIIESDQVRRTVIVQPNRKPSQMGYLSKHVNKKDRRGRYHIPSNHLEDVTFLLPKESQSKKLWVVITNPYQRNLAASLRKREMTARREKQNPQIEPMIQNQSVPKPINLAF